MAEASFFKYNSSLSLCQFSPFGDLVNSAFTSQCFQTERKTKFLFELNTRLEVALCSIPYLATFIIHYLLYWFLWSWSYAFLTDF